jgi:excisionase family DNA binding protein
MLPLLNVAEIAERLRCSQSLVYAAVASGRLRAYRIGRGKGGIRISEEQLSAFLQATESGGQSPPPLVVKRPATFKHLRV